MAVFGEKTTANEVAAAFSEHIAGKTGKFFLMLLLLSCSLKLKFAQS
jgi:hypothetical protein